jgi:hypothetical protein
MRHIYRSTVGWSHQEEEASRLQVRRRGAAKAEFAFLVGSSTPCSQATRRLALSAAKAASSAIGGGGGSSSSQAGGGATALASRGYAYAVPTPVDQRIASLYVNTRDEVMQLMRQQVINMLKELGGGRAPKDADILAWANAKVAESGKETRITSFKDPSIATGCVRAAWPRLCPLLHAPPPAAARSVFLLDLLAAVDPRAVNPALITTGESPEDLRKNAKYVLSVARKVRAAAAGGRRAEAAAPALLRALPSR